MSAKAAKKTNSVDFNYLSDQKVKKGEKSLLEETKAWKGGSHKERREEQTQQRDFAKASKKRGSDRNVEKVSWKKKVGGMIAIGGMVGVGLLSFLNTIFSAMSGNGVTVLDVRDSASLKSVLFGGEPWLIYCVNNQTQNQRLPQVLEDSTSSLWSNLGIRVGVLSCWDETGSGRSVAKRFKMKLSPPLQFVVANGNKPRKLDLVGLTKAEELEKKIKPALKVDLGRIDTLKKWPSLCTSRRTCVIVGHKQTAQKETALNLIRPIMESHRGTKFVTLDTSFWQLKLDDEVLNTRPDKGGQKGADVLCLARRDDAKGNATHSGTFLQQLTASGVSAFIKACESKSGLVPIGVPPRIAARPSKPKKVTAPTPRPPPTPRPQPRPRENARGNVDRVGSRAELEKQAEEEALFEAIEEGEEEGEDKEEEDEGGDSESESDEDSDSGDSEDDSDEESVEL